MFSQRMTNFKTLKNGYKYDEVHDITFDPITGEVIEPQNIYEYLVGKRLI